jgi:hypothetical protein
MFTMSYTTGIFLCSTVLFCIYAVLKMNRPIVFNVTILPAMVCGAMWAIASDAFQVANGTLGMSVGMKQSKKRHIELNVCVCALMNQTLRL